MPIFLLGNNTDLRSPTYPVIGVSQSSLQSSVMAFYAEDRLVAILYLHKAAKTERMQMYMYIHKSEWTIPVLVL
jgi:hypothetical protein